MRTWRARWVTRAFRSDGEVEPKVRSDTCNCNGLNLHRLKPSADFRFQLVQITSRSRRLAASPGTKMLAVIVPAHDEQDHIGACLASVRIAARCPRLNGEPVLIVVSLDACSDQTAAIARNLGVSVVSVAARNVGIARAHGARYALDAGARWLAFTDADSVVGPEWLSAQLDQRSDAVCGTVEVRDWGGYGDRLRQHHVETYTDADGHRHIHGANLGVTAQAYLDVGGFQPLVSSEDVALVAALRQHGASIAWSAAPRVVTSARRGYRAPGGFGETLARVDRELSLGCGTPEARP